MPLVPVVVGVAALVLALSSHGDVVVLAVLLAWSASRRARVAAVTVALASAAALVRWGSSSLGAIAGAQAVLGPAGWTGSAPAVASAWLAAAAILACTPAAPARLEGRAGHALAGLTAAPFAFTAADLAVGPGPGGAIAARVLATVVALVAGVAIARMSVPAARDRAIDAVALVLGAAALVLAGIAR